MERTDLLDVLTMVKSGQASVKSAAKMIELLEGHQKVVKDIKDNLNKHHEKTNAMVSPMYTKAYVIMSQKFLKF